MTTQIQILVSEYNKIESEQGERLAQICALLAQRQSNRGINVGSHGLYTHNLEDSNQVAHFVGMVSMPITKVVEGLEK